MRDLIGFPFGQKRTRGISESSKMASSRPIPSANSSRPFCSCPFILLTYQILQLRLNATCACLHFRDREREKMNTRPDNPNLTNPNTWARDEKPDFIRGICCHHIAFATYSGGLAFHEREVGGRNPCPKKRVCQQNLRARAGSTHLSKTSGSLNKAVPPEALSECQLASIAGK